MADKAMGLLAVISHVLVCGACSLTMQADQAPASAIKRFSQLSSGEWDPDSLSGPGSRPDVAQPFVEFFLRWLGNHSDIKSIVEASAGHWPSGWQRHVQWPALDYVGIDLLPEIIKADKKMVQELGSKKFGFKSMKFVRGDMLKDETLPKADLFFTKDTLIHFPNKFITQFLQQTALSCPPKYRYVMFVHDFRPRNDWNNSDIKKFGDFHGFNLQNPPFSVPVDTVFEWRFQGEARPHPRLVQVLDTSRICK